MTKRAPLPPRAAPPEVAELKRLKAAHPDLAPAVDLQISLHDLQRRVQSRVPMPWVDVNPEWLRQEQLAGRPLLRFRDLPIDWSDFRLMVRETADLLRRFGAIEEGDVERIQHLWRRADTLAPAAEGWFAGRADTPDEPVDEALQHVFQLAARPFLARCAEALLPQLDLSAWDRSICPLCGGEPELAAIGRLGERHLVCGRCTGQWPFDAGVCPHCRNADPGTLQTFALSTRQYTLQTCDRCRHYIKVVDTRVAGRLVMLGVDAVATLPLDAVAQQRGYQG
jgi:formate dehydrogenase maturation protein FdhE